MLRLAVVIVLSTLGLSAGSSDASSQTTIADLCTGRDGQALDPADPVDAAIAGRFKNACGRYLTALTGLSLGPDTRTYQCLLSVPRDWFPQTPSGPDQHKLIDEAFGPGFRSSLLEERDFLSISSSMPGDSIAVLLKTRDGTDTEIIHTRTALQKQSVKVSDLAGAATMIRFTNELVVTYADFCGATAESREDGWVLRDVQLKPSNCGGRRLARDYWIGRDGRTTVLAERPPAPTEETVPTPCD